MLKWVITKICFLIYLSFQLLSIKSLTLDRQISRQTEKFDYLDDS